ncbi:pumilio homolog 6, chloroplastic-like [Magnolia sinica]|uniref:pumilio homolog 6, chloroplastic-like n=1 Tax=Magnolia sinica TaxID=86752 RepID=UPI00265A503E|nr:pumilio homolog 6, chloroplastic-like [Magnolia sinica]XP_058114282.1 pumilio homolog 6, chloroplastic-like [Magnolia sinica]XP_058114283.1 pumilio homolog 6, chloroplastic-like [Magnolia sinica]
MDLAKKQQLAVDIFAASSASSISRLSIMKEIEKMLCVPTSEEETLYPPNKPIIQAQRGSEKFDDPNPFSFLEELKSNKACRFELSDIAGRIVEFRQASILTSTNLMHESIFVIL